jgi:hypothetical protein
VDVTSDHARRTEVDALLSEDEAVLGDTDRVATRMC